MDARRTFWLERVGIFLRLHGLQKYVNKALNNRYKCIKKEFSVLVILSDLHGYGTSYGVLVLFKICLVVSFALRPNLNFEHNKDP